MLLVLCDPRRIQRSLLFQRQTSLFLSVDSADGFTEFLLDLLIVVICQYIRLPGDLAPLGAHREVVIDSIEIVC